MPAVFIHPHHESPPHQLLIDFDGFFQQHLKSLLAERYGKPQTRVIRLDALAEFERLLRDNPAAGRGGLFRPLLWAARFLAVYAALRNQGEPESVWVDLLETSVERQLAIIPTGAAWLAGLGLRLIGRLPVSVRDQKAVLNLLQRERVEHLLPWFWRSYRRLYHKLGLPDPIRLRPQSA